MSKIKHTAKELATFAIAVVSPIAAIYMMVGILMILEAISK